MRDHGRGRPLHAALLSAVIGSMLALAPAGEASAEAPGFSLGGGIGFTAGPGSFLMLIEAPYAFNDNVSLGPQFQLGVGDQALLVAPALSGRIATALSFVDHKGIARTRIFAQLGLGMAYVSHEEMGTTRDGVAFMLNPGFGLEYPLTDDLWFSSTMNFNALPGGAAGVGFFYSWQMLGMRYQF
jgi:hypothetical protein